MSLKSKKIWLAIISMTSIYVILHAKTILEFQYNPASADFFFFAHIKENLPSFENSLTLDMVKKVEPISWLMKISMSLTGIGVSPTSQYAIFLCLQVVLVLTGIFLIVSGLNRSYQESILCSILFLNSYFSNFGRYIKLSFIHKVVTSTLGLSFGFLAIGFFIRGQFVISTWIAALMLYIHPTHALIVLSIFHTYILYIYFLKRYLPAKKIAYIYIGTGIIVLPWIITTLINSETIFSGAIDESWWTLIMSKISTPFPLHDGIVVVIPSLIIFALVYWLMGLMTIISPDSSYGRSRWVVASVLLAWLAQIIFTEILPTSFVTQLALTRSTPYAGLFMVIVYVGMLWMHKESDHSGAWLLFLLLPVVFFERILVPPLQRFFYGRYAIYPECLIVLFCLILYIEKQKLIPLSVRAQKVINLIWKSGKSIAIGSVITFGLLVAYKISINGFNSIRNFFYEIIVGSQWESSHIIALSLILTGSLWQRWRSCFTNCIWSSSMIYKRSSVVVFAVALIALMPHLQTLPALRGLMLNLYNNPLVKMKQFIDQYTEKNSMMLIIPLSDTKKLSTIPFRPVFLDHFEVIFVLYNPSTTREVIDRLKLMGMDFDLWTSNSNCFGLRQYLVPVCRQRVFARHASEYSDDWRVNLTEMRKIAPNLSYVLMKKKYMCLEDKPTYTSGDLALLHINDVHQKETCHRDDRI
jgi:hypothetical protein